MQRRLMKVKQMFQSTLPRGERLQKAYVLNLSLLFQSTLPRGERRRSVAVHPVQ